MLELSSVGLKLSLAFHCDSIEPFLLLGCGWKATPCLKENMPRLGSTDVKASLKLGLWYGILSPKAAAGGKEWNKRRESQKLTHKLPCYVQDMQDGSFTQMAN